MADCVLVRDIAELDQSVDRDRGDVGLVMTMGALHRGHASLMSLARQQAATVIVSVFVNPLQFGPTEDFDRYPRTLDDDLEICAAAGVDVVFAPTVSELYPTGDPLVRIAPGPVAETHEGALRPGLFAGTLTVVAKFLHLARPDFAVFGEKDAQQLALIRQMVNDLNFPVRIVGGPTVRESDGLALSSRNAYLSAAERVTALSLSRALRAAGEKAADGPAAVLTVARTVLDEAGTLDPPLRLDALTLVDAATFGSVSETFTGAAILGVVAEVGKAHLIDNMPMIIG